MTFQIVKQIVKKPRNRNMVLAWALTGLALATPLSVHAGELVELDTRLSQGVLKQNESQKVYLRIGIKGRPLPQDRERNPINVALVIDRSGSMKGSKIVKAREAAKMAINRLGGRDAASVIVFDNRVDTLVSARRVFDHSLFKSRIDTVRTGGQTAIFAAVKAAARQLRTYKRAGQPSRVILLSDGQANVGPRRAFDFAELGRLLGGEGISVTTIGLGRGYNEDLMSQLASASDGNHAFARTGDDLTRIFNEEFDDVLSVAAHDIEVIIETRGGVTPLRTLGRRGDISANRTRIKLNQVYSTSEFSLQLELRIASDIAVGDVELANVTVRYTAPDGTRRSVQANVTGRFSSNEREVTASVDPKVMEPILELEARERYEKVIRMRDKGQIKEARKLLQINAMKLDEGQRAYGIVSSRLRSLSASSRKQALDISDRAKWGAVRKQMRVDQSNRQGAKVKY